MKPVLFFLVILLSATVYSSEHRPYSTAYDPKRDAFADFKSATADAKSENKLVLIELGGDWCSWCHRLDKFLAENTDVAKELDDVFVMLKVNVSDDNMNEEFVATLPEIIGYPHFVIADSDGNIVGSQNTGLLEEGKGYSKIAFAEFINQWQ